MLFEPVVELVVFVEESTTVVHVMLSSELAHGNNVADVDVTKPVEGRVDIIGETFILDEEVARNTIPVVE